MRKLFTRRWFLMLLASVLAAGMLLPEPLTPLAQAVPQQAVVASVLFIMALLLDVGAMVEALRRPTAVLLATGISYVVLPLLAWAASLSLQKDLAAGLLIATAIPCTLASAAVWTRRAGGNDAVAILVMFITNLTCPIVAPLWLLATTGAEVPISFTEMAASLTLLVVLPMALGQIMRLAGPVRRWADAKKTPLNVLAQLGILTIVFVASVQCGRELQSGTAGPELSVGDWLGMLTAVVLLHTGTLVLGMTVARWAGVGRADRIAVGFAGSQKTLMIGLHIATVGPFAALSTLPLVAYHVGQLLIDTVIADRLAASPPEG